MQKRKVALGLACLIAGTGAVMSVKSTDTTKQVVGKSNKPMPEKFQELIKERAPGFPIAHPSTDGGGFKRNRVIEPVQTAKSAKA
jgi:hypothetical protein